MYTIHTEREHSDGRVQTFARQPKKEIKKMEGATNGGEENVMGLDSANAAKTEAIEPAATPAQASATTKENDGSIKDNSMDVDNPDDKSKTNSTGPSVDLVSAAAVKSESDSTTSDPQVSSPMAQEAAPGTYAYGLNEDRSNGTIAKRENDTSAANSTTTEYMAPHPSLSASEKEANAQVVKAEIEEDRRPQHQAQQISVDGSAPETSSGAIKPESEERKQPPPPPQLQRQQPHPTSAESSAFENSSGATKTESGEVPNVQEQQSRIPTPAGLASEAADPTSRCRGSGVQTPAKQHPALLLAASAMASSGSATHIPSQVC